LQRLAKLIDGIHVHTGHGTAAKVKRDLISFAVVEYLLYALP
jgi:hypothetical protein